MRINKKLTTESRLWLRGYIRHLKKTIAYMNDVARVRRLILKWKLNKSLLADKIGMPKTTFSYTLMGKPHYRFSPQQFDKLTKILIRMSDDLKAIR